MVSVAVATGQDPQSVLRQDYAVTMWTWCELKERERLDHLGWDFRSIMDANRTSMAYHAPHELKQEMRDYQSRNELLMTPSTARQKAEDMIRKMEGHTFKPLSET